MSRRYLNEYKEEDNDYKKKYFINPEIWKRTKTHVTISVIIVSIISFFIIDYAFTNIKILETQRIINRKLDPKAPPIIKYEENYGWPEAETICCREYAFAFQIMYGPRAKVVINPTHAFNQVGFRKVEPQGAFYKDVDYSITEIVKIKESDKEIFRRYLEL